MNISGNVIRFPAPPISAIREERRDQEPAKILGFPTPQAEEIAFPEMQERGQVFAAHRILTRVADQLESIAVL